MTPEALFEVDGESLPCVEAGELHVGDLDLVTRAVSEVPHLSFHEDDIGPVAHPKGRDFFTETFAGALADRSE